MHIERWLDYFHHNNLHIIDGDQLKSNPVDVLDQFQKFLKITPTFDYSSHIRYWILHLISSLTFYSITNWLLCFRYDVKKGFFCKVLDGGSNKCLGKGKGRQYPTMDTESYNYLREYYMPYNTALVKLLRKLEHTTIPQWLKDDLSYSSTWHLLRRFLVFMFIIKLFLLFISNYKQEILIIINTNLNLIKYNIYIF